MLIYFEKQLGETISESVTRFKNENPEYIGNKVGCAGKLDPMATGKLLLLTNETLKEQQILQNHDKIYEFTIVVGFKTDTYDILGKITEFNPPSFNPTELIHNYINKLNKMEDILSLEYPPYSAQRINGKPLWWYAKNNLLNSVKDKIKKIHSYIHQISILETKQIEWSCLRKDILYKLSKLSTKSREQFRYKHILDEYNKHTKGILNVYKITATVSSGTYIRSLCQHIADKCNVCITTMDIHRKEIINNV
jgi:tRNA pseudouridine(55) synthase